MALSIACWVRDTALEVNKRDIEYQKAFLGAITTTKTSLTTKIPGMIGFKMEKESMRMAEAKRQMKEYLWLYKG